MMSMSVASFDVNTGTCRLSAATSTTTGGRDVALLQNLVCVLPLEDHH